MFAPITPFSDNRPPGRVATETHPDGTVLHLAYDAANRLANLSLGARLPSAAPDSVSDAAYSVAYAYNSNGLLATVTSGDYATRYDYRANGQLASTVDYRVIDPQGDILRTDRAYDAGARLTEVANTAADGEQVGVRYTLSAGDQRIEALEETGQKWQYGYDGLKQLVTAKKTDTATSVVPPLDQSYSYDPMGNRRAYSEQGKSVAYASNSANQYVSISETSAGSPVQNSPVYDRNGNMLTDGVKNYTWDAENQLVAVTPVNPTEGSQRVEYTYDWRMRRKDKKSFIFANGAWALARTHTFKYHEWNPIEETITAAGGATETKHYVWGNDLSGNLHGAGGVGGLLSMRITGSAGGSPAASDNYFYAYDGNGNVRALVKADAANPAASAVVEKYAYDGFGRELAGSGSINSQLSSINTFRFSTKQLDAETGMNYYGYRYYAADAGRWINRDLIAELGGVNVYVAINNNEIAKYDINGLIDAWAGDNWSAGISTPSTGSGATISITLNPDGNKITGAFPDVQAAAAYLTSLPSTLVVPLPTPTSPGTISDPYEQFKADCARATREAAATCKACETFVPTQKAYDPLPYLKAIDCGGSCQKKK